MIKELAQQLTHLEPAQQSDILSLIENFPWLSPFLNHYTWTQHRCKRCSPNQTASILSKPRKKRINEKRNSVLVGARTSQTQLQCLELALPFGRQVGRYAQVYYWLSGVNVVTVPNSYPLLCMEDCVDNRGSAKFVTKLDLLKGYWQVPLNECTSEISAFVTPDCLLQYTVMAFGMCNAPRNISAVSQHGVGWCEILQQLFRWPPRVFVHLAWAYGQSHPSVPSSGVRLSDLKLGTGSNFI